MARLSAMDTRIGNREDEDGRRRQHHRRSVWQTIHVRRALILVSLGCAALLFGATPAHAQSSESARSQGGGGLTAGIGYVGVAGFRVGFVGWYSPLPPLSLGMQLEAMVVDNGADPQYQHGALRSATLVQAFADVRFFPRWVITPFVRVGVGIAGAHDVPQSTAPQVDPLRVRPLLDVAAGPELRLGPVYLKVQGTLTAMTRHTFIGWGAELGGAWPPAP